MIVSNGDLHVLFGRAQSGDIELNFPVGAASHDVAITPQEDSA